MGLCKACLIVGFGEKSNCNKKAMMNPFQKVLFFGGYLFTFAA